MVVDIDEVVFTTAIPNAAEILDAWTAFIVAAQGAAEVGGGEIAVPGQPWKIEPPARVADTVP